MAHFCWVFIFLTLVTSKFDNQYGDGCKGDEKKFFKEAIHRNSCSIAEIQCRVDLVLPRRQCVILNQFSLGRLSDITRVFYKNSHKKRQTFFVGFPKIWFKFDFVSHCHCFMHIEVMHVSWSMKMRRFLKNL